ncbi:unnamed protein product [Lymnaea stagnalis]|uniref:Uncharacterized protein n=1 Tax=Lymnaea stagnalis TaxID=6523 RepID=A0AAV2HAC1_LYMST
MAMNMHMEARRRQMFMERVCEARRRMALAQQQDNQGGTSSSFSSQSDPMVCQEQRMSNQTRQDMEQEDENVESYPLRQTYRPKKTNLPMPPKPKPCPSSLEGVKRDHVYKILHPYSEY